MIEDYRINFWDEHHITRFQGGTEPFPLIMVNNWQKFIQDKSVLEIGPGDGRQTKVLQPLAKKYAVADISKKALDKHNLSNKYLIMDYAEDFKIQFDTIVLFYVFHHIKETEVRAFITFLIKHLKSKGYICFNIPHKIHDQKGDGTSTSKYILENFKLLLNEYGLIILEEKEGYIDNYTFIVQKI